jgi:hypothetical protein
MKSTAKWTAIIGFGVGLGWLGLRRLASYALDNWVMTK